MFFFVNNRKTPKKLSNKKIAAQNKIKFLK
jgi:hypothetical protein